MPSFANIERLDQRPYRLPVKSFLLTQGERELAAKTLEFARKNPDLIEYCQRVENSFTANCWRKMIETGSMTEPQIAAIRRSLGPQRASTPTATRPANVQGEGFTKLLDGFKRAAASTLKRPKMKCGEFVFKLATEISKNPGYVYVYRDTAGRMAGPEYKGKIAPDGKFFAARETTAQESTEIERVGRDPFAAAVEHGKLTGHCSICSRLLTDSSSVSAGIGPICAKKFGW